MADINIDSLGERLKAYREERGIGQRELARLAGIEQKTLSRIESGEMKLVSPHINRLAKALQLFLSDPLGDTLKPVRLQGRPVPVWDHVQAGLWAGVDPHLREIDNVRWVQPTGEYSDAAFAMEVRGDSMIPVFPEGCVVVIDPEKSPRSGRYVLAKDAGGLATLKQYADRGSDAQGRSRFELRPLNDVYPTMRSDEQQIEILGVVVEKIERML